MKKKGVWWGLKYGRRRISCGKMVRPGKFSVGELSGRAWVGSKDSWVLVPYLSKLTALE